MADDLGTAVLRITVDDAAARESLRLLRQDVQRSSRVGGAGGRVQGGARDSIRALEQAQERRFRLSQRIERLESQGVNVSRLRARLGEQTTAQAQREFERSRRISVELSRQVRLAEARLQRERQLDTVLTRQARLGGARESVRGRVGLPGSPADLAFLARQGGARSPIGGRVGLTGSPADLAFLARQGGARSPIGGAVNIPGSPAFLAAQRRFEAGELSRAARLGGPRSPIGGSLALPGSPAFLQAALARSVQLGGPRSPIGGAVNIPGSPAAIRAEERLTAARQRAAQAAERAQLAEGRRIGRLNVAPLRGGTAFPGSPAFLRAALPDLPSGFFTNQRRALDAAARAGGARSPIGGAAGIPGSPAAIRAEERLAAARQRAAQAAERASQAEGRRIGRLNASPIQGGAAFPGSPAFLAAEQQRRAAVGRELALDTLANARQGVSRRSAFTEEAGKRTSEAISSGIIGGAFPLLFGQGLGAAAGGGLGGVAGGALGGGFGFGLSLVGTAVGTAFDEALNKGKALAAGLDDPIGKFDELRQAALFSSSATEKQIASLISQGREAEAAAQIQLDLLRTYGDTAELDGLKSAYDELGRAFNQLSVVTAKFVAGPLTEFITKLAATFGAQAARGVLNERIESLGIGEEGRTQLLAQAGQNLGRTPGLSLAQRAVAVYEEANRLLDERYGKQQKILEAEQDLQNASDRQLRIEKLRSDLVGARAQGEDRRAIAIQKELTDLERQQAVSAAPSDAQGAINAKALRDNQQLTADLLKLDRDRVSTTALQVAQFRLQSVELERQFAAAKRIAAVPTGEGISIARDTTRLREGLREQIAAARSREASIAAEIEVEQLRGGDAAEQRILDLQLQQVNAARETRNIIADAATQLRDAGQQLARDLRSSIVNFTAVRSDPQGLNRFLSPQDQSRRAQEDFQLLLPQFRLAQDRFRQLTGAPAREFSGPTASVNESIRDFINRVNAESSASESVIQTTQALIIANGELATSNFQLATATSALAQKDWNVKVFVDGKQQPAPLPGGGLP